MNGDIKSFTDFFIVPAWCAITLVGFEQDAGFVSLNIFDVTGRSVGARRALPLQHEWLPAGQHQFTFDVTTLSSGIYFAVMNAGGNNAVQKLLLVK